MRVAVLGAGFLGTGVALELARRGVAVDLYDRNDICITQAGLRNEGKIHLGFTYAKDGDFETAKLMARGALAFGRIVRCWVECDIADIGVSPPFDYAVHRDSLVPPEQIGSHFARVVSFVRDLAADTHADYLGEGITHCGFEPIGASGTYDPDATLGAFMTPERSIDAARIAELMRQRIADEPQITFLSRHDVTSVTASRSGWEVHCTSAGASSCELYPQVVNCLWDGRLPIDETAGLPPEAPWLHRLKFGIHLQLKQPNPSLPCTTIALGPYGDIVRFGERRVYLSWYPSCLTGMSSEPAPPPWPRELTGEAASRMIEATIAGLGETIVPLRGLNQSDMERVSVVGGIIFAPGETDIDDPGSQLHTRTRIGVRSQDGYHSADPGKYTMVPVFAVEAADRVCGTK